EAVGPVDAAIPQARRVFAPASPPPTGVTRLPATFRDRTIIVDTGIDGHRGGFVLDTGTASITLDRDVAERYGLETVLEHATVPRLTVGPLALLNASTLAIPLHFDRSIAGILGYDFFLGHVVHVDYAGERVEVLTPAAAAPAFADPRATIVDGYFDEGLPLVHAEFGNATGDRFALDTGSPHLLVLAPFERRYRAQIDALWSAVGLGRTAEEQYLEGSIRISARRVAAFSLAGIRFTDVLVGIEERNDRADAIDIPLDGIIGTDEMAFYEWWFDYDGGRIAVRRNNVR
ncbi:MAG TPA: retropepsin-like aspartic protease, partial [Xanthomonadales bacterium]|nr:retropepsin-like aspartic protease [Xanthomonadales bacterium]